MRISAFDGHYVFVHLEEHSSEYIIHIADVIGFNVAGELHSTLVRTVNNPKNVVVDCSTVERFDASALQLLYLLSNELRAKALRFEMRNVSEPVAAYIKTAGLQSLCE